jgi:hypothetical protein
MWERDAPRSGLPEESAQERARWKWTPKPAKLLRKGRPDGSPSNLHQRPDRVIVMEAGLQTAQQAALQQAAVQQAALIAAQQAAMQQVVGSQAVGAAAHVAPMAAAADGQPHVVCVLRLLIHNGKAGLLIGKGGGNMRTIAEGTGAKLYVHDLPPGCTERVVRSLSSHAIHPPTPLCRMRAADEQHDVF